jgi:hypothetical protein
MALIKPIHDKTIIPELFRMQHGRNQTWPQIFTKKAKFSNDDLTIIDV